MLLRRAVLVSSPRFHAQVDGARLFATPERVEIYGHISDVNRVDRHVVIRHGRFCGPLGLRAERTAPRYGTHCDRRWYFCSGCTFVDPGCEEWTGGYGCRERARFQHIQYFPWSWLAMVAQDNGRWSTNHGCHRTRVVHRYLVVVHRLLHDRNHEEGLEA